MNYLTKYWPISLALLLALHSVGASENLSEENFRKAITRGTQEFWKKLTEEKSVEPNNAADCQEKQGNELYSHNSDSQLNFNATSNNQSEGDQSDIVVNADLKNKEWNDYHENSLIPLGLSDKTMNFLENLDWGCRYNIAEQVTTLHKSLKIHIGTFNEMRAFLDLIIHPYRPERGWLAICEAVIQEDREENLFEFNWKGEHSDELCSIHHIISSKFPEDTPFEFLKTFELFVQINSYVISNAYAEICGVTKKYNDLTGELHPYWEELSQSEKGFGQGKEERVQEIKRRETEKTTKLQQQIHEARQFKFLKEQVEEFQKKQIASEEQKQKQEKVMQAEALLAQQNIEALKSSLQVEKEEKSTLQSRNEDLNNQLQIAKNEKSTLQNQIEDLKNQLQAEKEEYSKLKQTYNEDLGWHQKL